MFFASDNTGPVHPKVMEALAKANEGYAMPYGADPIMESVTEKVRDIFEAPEAEVRLVATGTAANSILLASLGQPYETVFCTDISHINEDECGAPEFYTGGSKLTLVTAENGKMTANALRAKVEAEETRGVHGYQRGPISITQATEKGTVYSLAEIGEISAVAKEFGLPLHMDGARFANALSTLGCTPAEMTWRSGVDAVSFGGTKNGLMGVEAAILFDPVKAKSWEFELRRKRGAHLFSKHRYLSAQMDAYLTDGLWLELAGRANATCADLTRGLKQTPDTTLHFEPQANMIFAEWPRVAHRRLHDAGAKYYVWSGDLEGGDDEEKLTARLVVDWSAPAENVETFLGHLRG